VPTGDNSLPRIATSILHSKGPRPGAADPRRKDGGLQQRSRDAASGLFSALLSV
jgi:hypothetical protein